MTHSSAAKRRFFWIQRRLRRASGSAAARRPFDARAQSISWESIRLPRQCHSRSRRPCSPLSRGSALRDSGRGIVLACPILQPRSGVFVSHGRDAAPSASQTSAAPAASLLDTMAALPRKWVSGGAPTLPWMNEGSPRSHRQPLQSRAGPPGGNSHSGLCGSGRATP